MGIGLVASTVLVLAACGTAGTTVDRAATTSTRPAPAAGLPAFADEQRLPPNDVGSLRALYDPALAELGVRVTRAELVDTTGNKYVSSNDGRHLAIYVEPTADYSDEQYLDGLWKVTALMTQDVFERWADLESYDLCQEPLPAVDDSPEPFPVTQVNITRTAAATIDWQNGDLVDLLVVARTDPDVRIVVNRQIRQTPAYAATDAAARTKAASVGTTTTSAPVAEG
jgi:hypothetical protein